MARQPNGVADERGYFRSEDGRPVVVVFDSKDRNQKLTTEKSWKTPILAQPSPRTDSFRHQASVAVRPSNSNRLRFINVSQPACKTRKTPTKQRESRQETRKSNRERSIANDAPTDSELGEQRLLSTDQKFLQDAYFRQASRKYVTSLSVSYPVAMQPYMYRLIELYAALACSYVSPSEPVYPNMPSCFGWLPWAMSNPAFFHVLLVGIATYQQAFNLDIVGSTVKVYHMKEAVTLLNRQLQAPDVARSSSTIVAIAHLADIEMMTGSHEVSQMHMNGLRQLVRLRGGIDELEDEAKLKLMRVDANECLKTLEKPLFGVPETDVSIWLKSVGRPCELNDGVKDLAHSLDIGPRLIDVLYQIQGLTSLLNSGGIGPSIVDISTTAVQATLLTLQSDADDLIQRFFATAMLLFSEVLKYSHFPPRMACLLVRRGAGEKLTLKLLACIKETRCTSTPPWDLIFWISFLGAITSSIVQYQKVFVDEINRSLAKLGIQSWEEARKALMCFPWLEIPYGDVYAEIWDKVSASG